MRYDVIDLFGFYPIFYYFLFIGKKLMIPTDICDKNVAKCILVAKQLT